MSSPNDPAAVIRQVCAIPFRRHEGRFKFCLITSLKKKRWIFPKGIIDPGETYVESALKEAYEEAGLRGHILDQELGHFDDFKWNSQLKVKVVMMEVTQVETSWPESDQRRRRWVSDDIAMEMLRKPVLQQFLRDAATSLRAYTSDNP